MTKLVGSVISALIILGVAWGLTQWFGDGASPLSAEWFTNATAKMEVLQNKSRDYAEDVLPDPDSLDLPTVPDPAVESPQ